jgi:hypothetical protein
MSRVDVGSIFLWAIELDKVLIKNPAFEFLTQYLLLLLRIPGGPMGSIPLLDQFLGDLSVASGTSGSGTANRITVARIDQPIIRIGGNWSGCA